MSIDTSTLVSACDRLLLALVRREYDRVVSMCSHSRLTARDLEAVIDEYGCTLKMPPEVDLEHMDVEQIQDAEGTSWAIQIPLWTQEEGLSDLTLELTITEQRGGIEVELDDMHVL